MQLARDRMDGEASATRDTPLPATVLAGILNIIESILGAKIAPEQPLMEVRYWRQSCLLYVLPACSPQPRYASLMTVHVAFLDRYVLNDLLEPPCFS